MNYDENDELDISDIVYFITYMFADMSPVELECPEEADVNGDNSVDIEDIVYLVVRLEFFMYVKIHSNTKKARRDNLLISHPFSDPHRFLYMMIKSI